MGGTHSGCKFYGALTGPWTVNKNCVISAGIADGTGLVITAGVQVTNGTMVYATGNAVAADVATGKTFSNATAAGITGSNGGGINGSSILGMI